MLGKIFNKHSSDSQRPNESAKSKALIDLNPQIIAHYGIPPTASRLAYDPIQQLLAIGTLDGRIKVIGSNDIEGLLTSPKEIPFKNLEFLQNQGFLIGVSNENDIQVWDLEHRCIASVLQWESNITSFSVIEETNYMYLGDDCVQVFTFKQLNSATSGFSKSNVIGQGAFGSVYRGVLNDGRKVAIKLMDHAGKHGEEEFKMEVELLSRLRSPYLLGLVGHCSDSNHKLLVYEFMANGGLQEHLYPARGSNAFPSKLDWETRLKIALDAAKGLEYLHEHVSPPVIHRDFKSSNILLDKNFHAKVSDFGLAKLGPEKAGGHVSTRVLGTQGYVAPEYALTGHLTTKSDVYSYGVVLLELLTGRVPVDLKRPQGEGVLVSWALPKLTDRERVVQIMDPALEGQYSMKEAIQVAAIAAMCVQPEADYRPLMADVVQSLVPLVKLQRSTSKVGGCSSFHAPKSPTATNNVIKCSDTLLTES